MSDYTKERLDEMLAKHKRWIDGYVGERADLRGADLIGANLSGADLSGADLSDANLRYTNLSDAIGFLLLPVQDARGYSFPHASLSEGNVWKIRVGCHFFTIDEAKEHWGSSYEGNHEQGDMYLHAIDWLESKIEVKCDE